jgi:hypothetical protein
MLVMTKKITQTEINMIYHYYCTFQFVVSMCTMNNVYFPILYLNVICCFLQFLYLNVYCKFLFYYKTSSYFSIVTNTTSFRVENEELQTPSSKWSL